MKLRNKKTGEIKEVTVDGYPVTGETKLWECSEMDTNEETGYKSLGTYTSLAELNEEWEDAPEEPKEFWFIDYDGGVISCAKSDGSSVEKMMKSIGNYFVSPEEAEKVVEKLKAWKRLKDKGFEFCGWCEDIGFTFTKSGVWQTEVQPDLDLLFGGEE